MAAANAGRKARTFGFRAPKSTSASSASPYNVQLSATETPGHIHVDGIKQKSADEASELLMVNHARYHHLFNEVGLHNHIVHHMLSLYSLGASPEEMKAGYDQNKHYQIPLAHHALSVAAQLKDPTFFKENIGKHAFYADFLAFWRDEIAERGVEEVLKEYVFKGDERADDMLARMYSGFEHPILHLGFALEFEQPCLIAEALAAASIHDDFPHPIVKPVEEYITANPSLPTTSLMSVISSLASDPIVSSAIKPTDPPNRITHGLLPRCSVQLPAHLANWRVQPTEADISAKTAEMVNVCCFLSGAAQNPFKTVSLDFFLMHSTNLSIFYPVFMGLSWLSLEQKARLLTWKGWLDAVMYAACGCPALYPERIYRYSPKQSGGWESIILRARKYLDDGHTSKLIRALMNGERCTRESKQEDLPLSREGFLQIAHMTMDSVERMAEPGYRLPPKTAELYIKRLGADEEVVRIVVRWVRWCGVDGAWDEVPDLEGPGAKL